jgi:hypothetical protein
MSEEWHAAHKAEVTVSQSINASSVSAKASQSVDSPRACTW